MSPSQTVIVRLLEPFNQWASQLPKRRIFAICVLLTCAFGFIDYLVGRQVSLSVIYAIPISIAAWYLGRRSATAIAVLSVILWIIGDIATGIYKLGVLLPLLNGTFRFTFYWLLIAVVLRLSHLQKNLEERAMVRGIALAKEIAERERLERELLEISERERQRFGQDIHDGLCQHLTGTALAGHVLAERLAQKDSLDAASASKVVSLVEEAILLARGMAKGLYPVQTDPDGLMQALDEFASTTSKMFGVDCRFECHSPVLVHVTATATHLFRIAQEAVGNAIKHGEVTQITIQLEEGDTGLRLAISDNGVGISSRQPTAQGMGLRIMADRAKVVGGQLSVGTTIKGGTEVVCVVPLSKDTGSIRA